MPLNSSIPPAVPSRTEARRGRLTRSITAAFECVRRNAPTTWPRLTFVALLALATSITGACSQNTGGSGRPPRTVFSSKEFNEGRQHGRRDAEYALFDDHAGWTWLWMMGEDYAAGYNQGWQEVRTHMRLRAEQEEARRRHEAEQQERQSQDEETQF